jgi:hypothetical protein
MGHDVFISYSSKDKPTADAVCATLESGGVRCWIAPRDILPGMDWGEAIVDGIKRCRVMILVFSSNANSSPQIRREVERAVNKGVPIIPFRIEEVMPTRSLEYFISTPHWMDAMTPPLEKHLQKLTDVVRTLLTRLEPRVTQTVAAPPSPVARAKQWIQAEVIPRLSRDRGVPRAAAAGSATDTAGRERRRVPLWAAILGVGLALIVLAAVIPRGAQAPAETAAGVTPPSPETTAAAVAPTAAPVAEAAEPVSPEEAPLAPPAETDTVRAVVPPASGFKPPASARMSGVFETRRGAEFHISPEEATVWIDGRRLGKADDWDGAGGGRTYYFRRPGTYYARFASPGHRTTWVRIVVRGGAAEEIVDIDTNLPELR